MSQVSEFEGLFDKPSKAAQENANSADMIRRLEKAQKDYKLQHVFREAAAQVQYFGGCLVYIDTGKHDPETLRQPLDLTDKSAELVNGGLKGFVVVEPINIFPGNYNSDNPLRADYFEPRSWWVLGREVHASRFIKMSSGDVPILMRPSYNFFGVPHAQILWDYVLHFQKDRVSTSRMLSKYSDLIFKSEGLRESLATPDGLVQIKRRLTAMMHHRGNDGITAIDKDGEDVIKVESSLAGLVDITRQDLGFLCAINRTPAEKLLGEPPAGFNSTGESSIRNYYDHIASQQSKICYDGLCKAMSCIQLSEFGYIDDKIKLSFKKLGGEDRQLENDIRKANTETLVALIQGEVITAQGAKATIQANPDEFLTGLIDGIEADEVALQERAAQEAENGSAEIDFNALFADGVKSDTESGANENTGPNQAVI